MRSWAFLVGLGFALTGCAVASSPVERTWLESRSQHFVVHSDVSQDEIRKLTREFETSYAAIQYGLGGQGEDASSSTHVVAMRNWVDFELIRPNEAIGFFVTEKRFAQIPKTIVFPLREWSESRETFQHELTHRFVAQYFPAAPPWLNEGLAEFFSSTSIEGSSVVFGKPRAKHRYDGFRWTLRGHYPIAEIAPQFEDLTTQDYNQFITEALHSYVGAWALVHVLMIGEARVRAAMATYLAALRTGDWLAADAFDQSFGPNMRAQLRDSYRAFLTRSGDTPTQVLEFAVPPTPASSVRELTLGEKRVLWGRLRAPGPDGFVRAMNDAAHAISAEPRAVDGYLLRAELEAASDPSTRTGTELRATLSLPAGGFTRAMADLRRAEVLAPNDPRVICALLELSLQMGALDTETNILAERLKTLARSALDFHALALHALARKEPEQALAFARSAVDRDAACTRCFQAMALAAFRCGQLELAVRAQRSVVNLAADDGTLKGLEQLTFYEKTLRQMRPHASPSTTPTSR